MCRKRKGGLIPWLAVIAGALILMVLIFPRWLWWLLGGAALLTGGILLLRR